MCAFLDDIYMVCEPERVRPLYNILGAALHREAGTSLHTVKTRVWNRGGIVKARVEELGPDVWNCDGIEVLGTLLGTAQFVASLVEERIAEERRLWEAIPSVPDLQCAWQILVQSANPRSNHTRSERCHPRSLQNTPDNTTKACGPQCKLCSRKSLPQNTSSEALNRWRHSPCAWVVWGRGPPTHTCSG